MSEPIAEPWSVGDSTMPRRGTIYRFSQAGDALPMHSHDRSSVHTTMVFKGSIVMNGPGRDGKEGWMDEGKAGAFFVFEIGQEHHITALEANTVILNELIYPMGDL